MNRAATTFGDADALASEVRRRTEVRALAIERDAVREAQRLTDAARADAEVVTEAIADQGARAAGAAVRSRHAEAAEARRSRALAAREVRIERVWTEAASELAGALVDPEGLAALARAAAATLAAAAALGRDLAVDVEVHAATANVLGAEQVAAWSSPEGPRLVLSDARLSGRGGGLVVRCGRASVDATFATRLASARERLRTVVDAHVRGEGGSPGGTGGTGCLAPGGERP
jgi:vacuolar-type H+-ATPase subunit E/Vma4